MIDDGECAGVPIGGLGTGSIGRTFRGDAARWHLEVGRHRFEPVAADGFAVFVGRPDGSSRATVLSALRPGRRAARPGAGTCPSAPGRTTRLFPRAWQTFEPEDAPGRAARRRAAVAGHRRRPRAERAAGRGLRVVGARTRARPADRRAPVHLGRPARRTGPWPAPGRAARRRRTRDGGASRSSSATPRPTAPTALRGTLAIAALAADGWTLSARADASTRSPTPSCGPTSPRDGRLEPPRRPRRPGCRPQRTGRRAPPSPRRSTSPRRAAVGPVRARLGPADGRVRRRPALVEALHPRLGPDRAAGRGPGPPRPRRDARPGARRSRPGRRPILDDPERPAWYATALFNELYFLVDGGTFWEAGEVGGAGARRATISGHFALLECVDYPFYDTVDVDFYASFALLALYPGAGAARHPRPARGDPRRRPRDRDHRGVRAAGAAQGRRDRPARRRRPRRRPVRTGPTGTASRTSTTGRTSARSSCSRSGATRSPPARRRRRADPRRLADRRRRADPPVGAAIATATACPSTTACPTRPTTPGRCTAHRPTAGSLWLAAVAAAEAMARRLGDDEAAAPLGRLVRARPGRVRPPAVARRPLRLRRRRRPELGQHHGRPARRPVVRRRDRPRRPAAPRSGRRGPAHGPPR